MEIFYITTGIAAGFIIAWLLRTLQLRDRMGFSKEEAARLDAERSGLLIKQKDLETRLELISADRDDQKRGREAALAELAALQQDLSGWKERYRSLEDRLNENKKEVLQLQEQFQDNFKVLANEILDEKTKKFTEQNKQNLDLLLNPLGEKLVEFQKTVKETYDQEMRERLSLQEQIRGLSELNQQMTTEAGNLVKALKGDSKTQGNWGEMILENILEKSGLRRNEEYTVQESLRDEEGRRLQPDVIVNLPDGKHLVIDAKVSLTAYERFNSADDDDARNAALREHISSIRSHVKGLSGKNYQNLYEINSPNFVLMFIPIEPAFGLALQGDAGLYNEAFEKNIVMVSPSTLLATLATIANVWKQEYQNRNAMEIARQGGSLYDKFVGFVDDLENMGKQLDRTRQSYDAAMNKLQSGRGNLVNSAEKLRKLGVKTAKKLGGTAGTDPDDDEANEPPTGA